MDQDGKCCRHFSIEETEDGYTIHIKGDKKRIKAKLEAIEAYWNFKKKAREAGFGPHFGHHHHWCESPISKLHQFLDEMEDFHRWKKEKEEKEND